MRRSTTVQLDEGRRVTVREMQARHVHALFGKLSQGGLGLEHLMDPSPSGVTHLLGDCLELPEGEAMADQVPRELERIWQGFKEVNQYFFAKLEALGLGLQAVMPTLSASLSGNAAASSSADTATSGTTVGGSSSPPSSGRMVIESEAQRPPQVQDRQDEAQQQDQPNEEPQPVAGEQP